MPFVLDASAAASWAFEDEAHPAAAAALSRLGADRALVPTLWWFEVRNALVINERRGRISQASVTTFLGDLGALPIRLDDAPEEEALMDLARRHRLTIYDAAYLELAQRRGLPLATLDRALASAAALEGVETL